MYKKLIDPFTSQINIKAVQRISDGAFIPFDEANTHYQEYIEWVAQGNTPEAAD